MLADHVPGLVEVFPGLLDQLRNLSPVVLHKPLNLIED